MIKKVLVANRGEIALRIMRTCKEMGIATVAVFSDADRTAPYVLYADEAVHIGAAPSAQSYLVKEKIIEACLQTGADAVHPGYGFLSENADFARMLKQAGITLIGPNPEAMEIMGSKLQAKAAAKAFNVPLVPGLDQAITDVNYAKTVAKEIGYPVLIKASAGGGGKGMRIVESEADFEEQMGLAVSEATSAFGDGAVFIEKYVASPRHIEIQVLADTHGNSVYLFERECSVQRRHQKVIEEAPSAILSPEIRKAMGECAVAVAKSCNYTNAGTVEFIVDDELNFYFLEMNTRLQVEHPVTEMITGVDLVREQIKIAQGEVLSFTQDDLTINGHAIEVRVYAEDPTNNFLPDIGTLIRYRRPQGMGIRVDDGVEEGMAIPIYYDPMLAKLVVHGVNRTDAINRTLRAIADYDIVGVETTLGFCTFVLQHPAFISGDFDTHFVKKYFTPEVLQTTDTNPEMDELAAILATQLVANTQAAPQAVASTTSTNKWKQNRLK